MTTKSPRAVDREFVLQVGGHVLATQLAGLRDPSAQGDVGLDRLADLSVRAAIALDAAIPRAEERLAAEAKAAEEAKAEAEKAAAAVVAAEKASVAAAEKVAAESAAAEKAAAKESAAEAKADAKAAPASHR